MGKAEFISIFELTLVSANLDVTGLSLIDNNHVLTKTALVAVGTRSKPGCPASS